MKLYLVLSIVTLLGNLSSSSAFMPGNSRFLGSPSSSVISSIIIHMSDESAATPPAAAPVSSTAPASKGFGKKVEKNVDEEVEVKDAGTLKYERDSKRGVPEYNIFMRPANGEKEDWVPVGSMTIPRDTPPSNAIFEVEQELLKGTFKLYPKLKAFYDVRKDEDKESTFEYGYVLKNFPDEEITVAIKKTVEEQNARNPFLSWMSKITNPVDTSDLKNPGQMTMKQ